ncbi:MAG: nucleotidyl transferase AbiEii/AbiGii toxin family protein [Pseudomonadota bacterium]
MLLLDTLYALSGSERIIFQGGTALRWVYGGNRFSEDLDFVTPLPLRNIQSLLATLAGRMKNACIAQFGPGTAEMKPKTGRESSLKAFYVYRPNNQRERIAVKMEFERLAGGALPESRRHILRDLPHVPGLIAAGRLVLPYTSSILVVETAEEILSDKIRALFERKFLKGRDVYDLWWLSTQMSVHVSRPLVERKMGLYQAVFTPERDLSSFQDVIAADALQEALRTDLPRFIPAAILSVYQEANFAPFVDAVRKVTAELIKQGMAAFDFSATK